MDLIGKQSRNRLSGTLGDSARNHVEVYDGTLYFSDVWFRDRGVRAVVEEVEEAAAERIFSVKLDRPRMEMDGQGSRFEKRDIEIVQAVRKAVGPKMKIMADANNGYQKDIEGRLAAAGGDR